MFGVLVRNISGCLQTVADLIELERGKCIRYHRMEFRTNVQ